MPNFEYEFSDVDRQIIFSEADGSFGAEFDYIRLTIYSSQAIDNIVTVPSTGEQAIFYSSLNPLPFDINISPFGIGEDIFDTYSIGGTGDGNDFKIYQTLDSSGNVLSNGGTYIKPNEIFNKKILPEGSYRIQIDFLNQVGPPFSYNEDEYGEPNPTSNSDNHYQFIIKQISTSRKEIRLKLLDKNIDSATVSGDLIISLITDELNKDIAGNQTNKYQFRHVINTGTGDHIPITNYQFDTITDGRDNQSIILKLYDILPTNVTNLSMVTIEREVLITQTEEIYYFSDVPAVYFGTGLSPDGQENWINPGGNNIGFENYDEVSGSIDSITLDNIISSSNDYPNLNTNFNEFENHTFFGSAKRKLENFKNKVETIQGHYSRISSSLHADGVAVDGDSIGLIQDRKNLFKKINDEIRTFTPYERFLYYDGQSRTSISAPGLGPNYADTIPVKINNSGKQLNNTDGFNVVYKHSSEKVSGTHNKYIDLFTAKYNVEDKPFFNYSGSIYLSFLMKGDSGSAITWENRNVSSNNSLGAPLPHDSLHQNNISNPDITSSQYHRYIFQASQSYFIPTTIDNDVDSIEDWTAGSNEYEILSGSIKTGSVQIKDSTGLYPTTIISSSAGIPFKGSIMPAGELFRIFIESDLSSSLSGSWNLDSQTSGAAVTNAMLTDFSGRENTGSIEGTPLVSTGLEVHNRNYGNSFLFQSESNEGVRFFSDDDFNYGREDNFSLSVWAKRFHSNTGSADPSTGTGAQPIFTRGAQETSYGIDYDFVNNKVRAGVRPDSSNIFVQHTLADDLLEWHHLVFTFESGSSTGMKFYVDGDLKGTSTTTGTGYRITGSNDFTSSVASIGTETDSLHIGGNNVLGGSSRYYNGFIQYPRVYNKAITQTEVSQLYLQPDGILNTKITDVKVSLNDPTNVLPFDNVYHTSSANWTNWYNEMYDSASTFDTDNIHSLENNLPLYIQQSNDYSDMKDFLSLQGEQYDLFKNHIDSMGTLHNRGYKKTNSPPNNSLPMLLNNMGWEAINPFSGSLTDSLGSYLSGVTSIDDIKNNTWRKTLNNLLYIYKSKGTQNSVRALLNVYGYPPDVLNFNEQGGGGTDGALDLMQHFENLPPNDKPLDLEELTGSFGYSARKQKLYRWMSRTRADRILNLDWWMDSANLNSFEFVYKHKTTRGTQTILKSSGSGDETLWDLRLIPSTGGDSSSFEFRLNTSNTGSFDIATNSLSMSLSYNRMTDGQLWNVMLQRMTGSISGSGINEYRLHSSLQNGSKIKTYSHTTMSVSGGFTIDNNHRANQNFISSGSRHALSSSNLFVGGETLSGSLAEIKGWSTALSKSKFRQHTFNKFSTVGNSINSHDKELIYHFKLNENYNSSSISESNQKLAIIDAAPKCSTLLTRDYSFTKNGSIFTGSVVYGFDIIDVVTFGWIDNTSHNVDNNIIVNPEKQVKNNLSPYVTAIEPLEKSLYDKPDIITSNVLEINRSPQNYVNDYILNNLDGFSFENYYSNPKYYYSSSYDAFDVLRKEFFNCHPIEVDNNKFIRAHENMFNFSIVEGIKKLVPARSTMSDKNANMGVEIKPTILEKQKYGNEKYSVEPNPNTTTGSLGVISIESVMTGSILISPMSGSVRRGYTPFGIPSSESSLIIPSTTGSKLELPYSASIKISDSGSLGNPYNGVAYTSLTSSIINPPSASISTLPSTLTSGSGIISPTSGLINYASRANESYTSVHKNWGTSSADTQFINFAGGTGSYGRSQTTASLSFTFIQSASNDSKITLTSFDGTTELSKTYVALSSSINGTLSGSFVLFNTGSGATIGAGSSSVAGNLLAAITSSNGHLTKFTVSQNLGIISLNQPFPGPLGNDFSASFLNNFSSSLSENIDTKPFRGGDTQPGNFNTYHIDTRFHFISIGDTEIYSGSRGEGSFNYSDFSNPHRLYNRIIVSNDIHSGITYESYITGSIGEQVGRMMGKTRYFLTGSDGAISALPSNHYSKFSYPFKEQMYNGAQNTNPGILNVQYEDYSTSSFYRVNVTGGENEIIVRSPGSVIDSSDKIIYGP